MQHFSIQSSDYSLACFSLMQIHNTVVRYPSKEGRKKNEPSAYKLKKMKSNGKSSPNCACDSRSLIRWESSGWMNFMLFMFLYP